MLECFIGSIYLGGCKQNGIIDVTDVIYVCGTIEKQGFVVFPRGGARIAGSIPQLEKLKQGIRDLNSE